MIWLWCHVRCPRIVCILSEPVHEVLIYVYNFCWLLSKTATGVSLSERWISTLWHFRLPLPIQMFIKVASSPRLSGIGMPSPILWSHPLKMQRIVLLSSLLWWELGTNSLITGPGEWLSFRRFTSNYPDPDPDRKLPFEPCHEIMVLFILRKLILQMHVHSHPVGLEVWYSVGPYVYFHTSCVQTAKALARLHRCACSPEPSLVANVISTIISWAGSFLVFWLKNLSWLQFFLTFVLFWKFKFFYDNTCWVLHSCLMPTRPKVQSVRGVG